MPRGGTTKVGLEIHGKNRSKHAIDSAKGGMRELVDHVSGDMVTMAAHFAAGAISVHKIGEALHKAIEDAMRFEYAIAELSTMVDSAVVSNQSLARAVHEASLEWGSDQITTAKALYEILSAGAQAGAEANEILRVSMALAAGGITDVAISSDALTTILNAYNMQASESQDVSDIMFETMRMGKTTIGELSQHIGMVAATSALAGMEFEEVGAILGAVTKAGIQTDKATVGLNNAIQAIINPSKEAAGYFKMLGIETGAAAIKEKGFLGIMQQLKDAGVANADAIAKLIPEARGYRTVAALLADGLGEVNWQLGEMEKRTGATERATSKIMPTMHKEWEHLGNAIEVAATNLGTFVVKGSDAGHKAAGLTAVLRDLNVVMEANQKATRGWYVQGMDMMATFYSRFMPGLSAVVAVYRDLAAAIGLSADRQRELNAVMDTADLGKKAPKFRYFTGGGREVDNPAALAVLRDRGAPTYGSLKEIEDAVRAGRANLRDLIASGVITMEDAMVISDKIGKKKRAKAGEWKATKLPTPAMYSLGTEPSDAYAFAPDAEYESTWYARIDEDRARRRTGESESARLLSERDEMIEKYRSEQRFANMERVAEISEKFKKEADEIQKTVMEIGIGISSQISEALADAILNAEDLGDALDNIMRTLASRGLAMMISGGIGALVGSIIGGPFGGLTGFAAATGLGIKPEHFASGGLAQGGTRGVDSIPAYLQHDELVLPADMTRRIRGYLGAPTVGHASPDASGMFLPASMTRRLRDLFDRPMSGADGVPRFADGGLASSAGAPRATVQITIAPRIEGPQGLSATDYDRIVRDGLADSLARLRSSGELSALFR